MGIDHLHAALRTSLGDEQHGEEAEPAPTETASPEDTAGQAAEPAAEDAQKPSTPQEPGARPRAVDGKFTKTPKPQAQPANQPPATKVAAGVPAPGDQPQPQQASPPPRTWGAPAREQWAQVPREVKDQILKREGEVARERQELQHAKQGYQRFQEAMQPFMPHLQALGVPPEKAIRELFQMEYTLRAGTLAERTGLIVRLMDRGGVAPEALAAVLDGQPPPQAQGHQIKDPRVDVLLGQVQQLSQRRSSDATTSAAEELRAFEATGPEFLDDVGDEMAEIITSARRRGKPITLQQAYERACQMHDDVRTVLEQRRAEEARRAQSQKVQQARYAAGSVQSEPAPPASGKRPGIAGMWAALEKNLGER